MKLISWNINGIRAQLKKDLNGFVKSFDADIFIFQETKATIDIVKDIGTGFSGYHVYANEAVKKGYSGTAIFTKEKPISETYVLGIDEHDREGRITALEFEKFYLVNMKLGVIKKILYGNKYLTRNHI